MNDTKFVAPGRRVVTGINDLRKSVIVSDGLVSENATWMNDGLVLGGDLWIEENVPVDLTDQSDPMIEYVLQEWPPLGGAIVRMINWQPGFSYPMHRSNTIDFMIILSGQIELILEDNSTILKAGDTLIQRGTSHAWRVVGDESCTIWTVLIDATSAETEGTTDTNDKLTGT